MLEAVQGLWEIMEILLSLRARLFFGIAMFMFKSLHRTIINTSCSSTFQSRCGRFANILFAGEWSERTVHDRGGTDGAAFWMSVKCYFQPRSVHQISTTFQRHGGSVFIDVARTSTEVAVFRATSSTSGWATDRRRLYQRRQAVSAGTGWSNYHKSETRGTDVGACAAGIPCFGLMLIWTYRRARVCVFTAASTAAAAEAATKTAKARSSFMWLSWDLL